MRRNHRLHRFLNDVLVHTPFLKIILLLVGLWLLFSAGLFYAERGVVGTSIRSYADALYWAVAGFSTAGIADTPITGMAKLIGAVWIVLGSMLFFGAIVSSITAYFMRPLQRPARQIIDTIEYNLERLDDLTLAELDLLKETADALIEHMELIKEAQARRDGEPPGAASP